MEKNGWSEALFLSERIELLKHIEDLQFGPPIQSLPMAELRAHCQALVHENLCLPYDLRCKVLERYANHYMLEIKDATGDEDELQQYLEKYFDLIAVWEATPPSAEIDELSLTAAFILECMDEDISMEKARGLRSQDLDDDKEGKPAKKLPDEMYKVRRGTARVVGGLSESIYPTLRV